MQSKRKSADARQTARHDTSRPILDALDPWLREKLALIIRKSKLAEAIRYALSRWNGLTLFVDDGRVEIDSNAVERAIRPNALNSKDALFAGSDGGAEYWAIVASLIATCKLIGVDPNASMAAPSQRSSMAISTERSTNCCLGPTPRLSSSSTGPENSP